MRRQLDRSKVSTEVMKAEYLPQSLEGARAVWCGSAALLATQPPLVVCATIMQGGPTAAHTW